MKNIATAEMAQMAAAIKQSGVPVFKYRELKSFVDSLRIGSGIPSKLPTARIVESMVEAGEIEKFQLNFPFRRETRYITERIPPLEKLLLTYPNAYFSHHTAAVVNGLLESDLTKLFLNNEQRTIPRPAGELSQERIDFAFRGSPRITTNTTIFSNCLVHLLNGKNTNSLGVVSIDSDTVGRIRVTNIERTLIDMVVRPFYSGGSIDVLSAFRNARSSLSVTDLKQMLLELDYVYPYHQAIGFYLQATGYSEEEVDQFREFELRFDFYLEHAMIETDYSSEWRIYYPRELGRILRI